MKNETDLIKNLKTKQQKSSFPFVSESVQETFILHIRKLVLNHDDTDDVLQNTFVKVFRGINKFKGDSKLYTWMYRIATNESLNFLKSKSKKHFHNSEEMFDLMVSNLKEDPYFNGDELQYKLQLIIKTSQKTKACLSNEV